MSSRVRWRAAASRRVLVGAGMALAVTAAVCGSGVAGAAPGSFADKQTTKRTGDGWVVSAVKSQERVRSVPPLNQSSWTREGFLSLRGEGLIAGTGSVPVQAGTVAAGFQIGCNTDVTSGVTVGVSGGPSAQMNISYPPAVVIGATVTPNVSTTLRPGTIADIPFGSKKLQTGTAGITVDGVHVKVDGCLGPVALRAYVTVSVSTALNDNTINVYGEPHYL
ncbi:MspA family porin [Gordonia sp. DT30]|uniref:MspA family porin n=1 Tax=Gordonia sp. DT30 TaxID=3416546 RepID=UPI003CF33700